MFFSRAVQELSWCRTNVFDFACSPMKKTLKKNIFFWVLLEWFLAMLQQCQKSNFPPNLTFFAKVLRPHFCLAREDLPVLTFSGVLRPFKAFWPKLFRHILRNLKVWSLKMKDHGSAAHSQSIWMFLKLGQSVAASKFLCRRTPSLIGAAKAFFFIRRQKLCSNWFSWVLAVLIQPLPLLSSF